MKRVLLSLLISIWSYYAYSVNVTGNAFLDNTTNHSGIEVRFNPESPSAQFASCNTLSTGEFEISIQPGIYSIEYYKEDYQLFSINEQRLIIEDCSLEDVTLLSKLLVDVSGNVSGDWTNDVTYNVTGNISVPSGSTLTIEEGTLVQFTGKHKMYVDGKLLANGTETDMIKFTSANVVKSAGDWDGIFIRGNETSIISHSILEYGGSEDNKTGIVNSRGNLKISNCTITNSERYAVLVLSGGYVVACNNTMSEMSRGILCSDGGRADISLNTVFNCGYGIGSLSDNAYIFDNIVHDCSTGILGYENIIIENNILYENEIGVYLRYCETPICNNNTMLNNLHGIKIEDSESLKATISHNIFVGSTCAIYGVSESTGKPSKIEYNLFYNNSSIYNGNFLGLGSVITQNSNGTPCDTYLNLFDDPSFVTIDPNDENFIELSSSSICIDAGDPNLKDEDGTTIDIGAKAYNSVFTVIEDQEIKGCASEITYNNLTNEIILNIESESDYLVNIYNLSGKKVVSHNFKGSIYHRLSIANLQSGMYIVNLYDRQKSTFCSEKILKH